MVGIGPKQSISQLTAQNANTYLSQLFGAAAGVTDSEGKGLKSKGLQIADAMTDPGKKITLQGPEVDRLLSHVDKLPDAEKANALKVLDFFRDKFEVKDEAARKKLIAFVPKHPVPLPPGGRTQTVAEAKIAAATAPPVASAKDIKAADATIDYATKAAGKDGKVVGDEMHKALHETVANGELRANPDGGRQAFVGMTAKRGNPQENPFEKYANSPWFEDRLMAALGKNSMKFMNEMNEKLGKFDDPKRDDEIRATMKSNVKELLAQAQRISPEGKARVAQQIVDYAKANPELVEKGDPVIKEFMDLALKSTGGDTSHDDLLKKMPPASDAVLAAMDHSTNPQIQGWSAVFKASRAAEEIQGVLGDTDLSKMGEESLRKVGEQAGQFQQQLAGMKRMLPQDAQDAIPDVKLAPLPDAIDANSRQVMMQSINMMMNQYQQIMQAMSEILNKMNEMAMDPIRKMGR